MLAAAGHPNAGESLSRADRQIRIGFVIPELHIEPWVEFLDPGIFQRQRFQFGADHRPLEAPGGQHHGLGARMQQLQRLEVVGQSVAQVLRLAHVDDASLPVTPLVDAGLGRDVGGLRTERIP